METELWERREAQDRPARPEPMIMTSVVSGRGSVDFVLKDMDRDVVDDTGMDVVRALLMLI